MRAFKVFMFGLLYGWVIKVAFDRIYRDHEIQDIRNENVSLKDYIHSLEKQLRFSALETNPSATQPIDTTLPARPPAVRDDLKRIKGIGPAIERKLNAAGVQTFADLADLSKTRLESILGSQVGRLQDENDLIAQAKKLARKK